MQRQNHQKISQLLNQDYILSNYRDTFLFHTIGFEQQQKPNRNLSLTNRRSAKPSRQIPINLDIYIDQLTTTNTLVTSKIRGDINNTISFDQDELKQDRYTDQSYSNRERKRYRSTINPKTITRNNRQEQFIQNPEQILLQTSRYRKGKYILPLKVNNQSQIGRITKQFCQNQRKFKILNKFRTLIKVIGRILMLYFRLFYNVSDDYFTQKAKIDQFNSLKTAFKIDRKFDQNLMQIIQEWTSPAFQKVLYYMEKNYDNNKNDQLIDNDKIKDQELLWCFNYAKFLFQNIELITRKGNIPIEIIKQISKVTLLNKNTYMTLFLARRIKFQNSPLSKTEYQLIASEYLYFNIILNQLFDQANKLKFQNLQHNLQQKKTIIELASMIHTYFIKYFVNMPKREDISDQILYQRKLYIFGNKNQELILLDTKDVSQSENIIIGLKSGEHIKNLLNRKQNLKKLLGKLFDKTIQNIYSQIEICDNLE